MNSDPPDALHPHCAMPAMAAGVSDHVWEIEGLSASGRERGADEAGSVQEEDRIADWRINMVYLKSVLAGIGGSILALILLVLVVVAMNVLNRPTSSGMVLISVVGPIPIGVAALGFILGFYLVFRR
jgi:hypothetical protein